MAKNFVLPIPLSSINSATFTGSYQLLSAAAGLPQPCFLVRIINFSSVPVTVSYDGVNDHDFVHQEDILQLNFQTNAQPQNWAALLAKGTKIYVKGSAGTGNVYLAAYYSPS